MKQLLRELVTPLLALLAPGLWSMRRWHRREGWVLMCGCGIHMADPLTPAEHLLCVSHHVECSLPLSS